jgi:hypothetical protein
MERYAALLSDGVNHWLNHPRLRGMSRSGLERG